MSKFQKGYQEIQNIFIIYLAYIQVYFINVICVDNQSEIQNSNGEILNITIKQ